MSIAVTLAWLLAGLINLYPLLGVLGAPRLAALYGLPFDGTDLELLMRHRAVMLGLLGALLIAAAFRTRLRPVAAFAGLVSMLGFMVLALPLGTHNAAIQRVFWGDTLGSAVLLGALWLGQVQSRR